MVQSRDLTARFEAYGDWRRRLASAISGLHDWLGQEDLADAQIDAKLQRLQESLPQDKLVVAFVAEFSRGKSELINAIFFADFGKRLLPSSAGRTTMCPTELFYDPSWPTSIRLLPIETRAKGATVAEFRNYADEWVSLPLDLSSADQMSDALSRVSQVKRVPDALAAKYGLYCERDGGNASATSDDGLVEIPCWRHALINFPHPLLQRGLVILDTPGLNAIGTEPELTLHLLQDAHAVVFILAADTGVTSTDHQVWTRHVAAGDIAGTASRIVVLNKIDGLWDELKTGDDVDAEIASQLKICARTLGLPTSQVFAVSAQKALLAKVNGDDLLLAKSRLPMLEEALSGTLIPAKRDIVGVAAQSEVKGIAIGVRAILDGRKSAVSAELAELITLRGKNQDVVTHMMERVRHEKESFERGLQRFTALRTVFSEQTNKLFDEIGQDALRANAARTRRQIEDSPFTKGIRAAMSDFFTTIRGDFDRATLQSAEIQDLMRAMYARFAAEDGLQHVAPQPFSLLKYRKEIDRLEHAYNAHFNTLWNMLSTAKFALMHRFFETIASRVKHVYKIANRDVESWLRMVMAPLETQVRERHVQLRRRLDSIKRIHQASGELEERVAELEQAAEGLIDQLRALEQQLAGIDAVVTQPDIVPLAANA
jgi:hypothetical protein